MTRAKSSLHYLLPACLCLLVHVDRLSATAHACTFPDFLQLGDDGEPWYSHVRYDGSREYAYYVRHNALEIRHVTSSGPSLRWACAADFRGTFLLKRTDEDTEDEYSACVRFVRRGQGVVQMLWTPEARNEEWEACDDKDLVPDSWLLVSFQRVMRDYAPSPFSGGYSMRITDSDSGENACNYIHRPMKLESDCLGGEGVLFDFIAKNCLPSADMAVKQRTLTVATWSQGGDDFVVLRHPADVVLYCLRLPTVREDHMNVFLFRDLTCLPQAESVLLGPATRPRDVKYMVLHLQKYLATNLCDDEYPQCSAVACDGILRHECQKSCKVCDPKKPPVTCSFPRRLRGSWLQTDVDGYHHVNISESELSIGAVGSFRCVLFPDSPARKNRLYTTLSTFINGCRPRYTCLKFKRLGPSALRYTLSRSVVWSDLETSFGDVICSDAQFVPDPEPIGDLYRSQEDGGKPIISLHPAPERVPCNLHSSFSIATTFPNGSLCHGSLFEHCEDSSRLRIEFHADCGQLVSADTHPFTSSHGGAIRPVHADFSCLARFEGHSWENLLLLQNDADASDVRCLVSSQLDVSEAVVVVAGQCDKNSWNYARAGLRAPLLALRLRPDEFPCKYLPPPPSPATPPSGPLPEGASGVMTSQTRRPTDVGGFTTAFVFSLTLSPPQGDPHQRHSAPYQESHDGEKTALAHRPELSAEGNEARASATSSTLQAAGPCLVVLVAVCYWIAR